MPPAEATVCLSLLQIIILTIVTWPQIHYVAKGDLELLTLLSLPPGIAGTSHHAWLLQCWEWNPELPACQASRPPTQLQAAVIHVLLTHFPDFSLEHKPQVRLSGCYKQTQLRVFVAWFLSCCVLLCSGTKVMHIRNKIIPPTLIS